MVKTNKAAMFGLDARIALAIFGALSVISGAALYNVIQDSKATALYTQITEFEKAIEAIFLEYGYFPISPLDEGQTSYKYHLDLGFIVNNVLADNTWKGPYIPGEYSVPSFYDDRLLVSEQYEVQTTYANYEKNDIYACGVTYWGNGEELLYINFNFRNSTKYSYEFLKYLHDKFDNDGDYIHGKIIVSDASPGNPCLLYKINNYFINSRK